MVLAVPAKPAETLAQKWHRLAKLGRAEGVVLLTEATTGERFATSATVAGEVYRLTPGSCSCKGFAHYARCKHLALLLAELGRLPALPCGTCGGIGTDPGCAGHPVAGGVLVCGCPACGAPDAIRPGAAPVAPPPFDLGADPWGTAAAD